MQAKRDLEMADRVEARTAKEAKKEAMKLQELYDTMDEDYEDDY